MEEISSFCRTCAHGCAVKVQVESGKVVGIKGDPDDPLYAGYSCIKGREHWTAYDHPDRLLHSLKKLEDGSFARISTETALDEVAERLRDILDRHEPEAVAMFWGQVFGVESAVNLSMYEAFMKAIESPMAFSSITIDSPGKAVAKGFHGMWGAPGFGRHEPDLAVLVGTNPLVSHYGAIGHPRHTLKHLSARGGKLIVLDPRRTDTAKRATIHLQLKSGTDALVLGALCHIILDEGLEDSDFLAANVAGVDVLREAVSELTPERVAGLAGVEAEDLIAAARLVSSSRRAYAAVGTGPNMGGRGTLVEYLALCLTTICGHWMRAGEQINNSFTLTPKRVQRTRAQAIPPFRPYDVGHRMRVRGLTESLAGMPTGALADEILLPGKGQIRGLISLGGNPASSVPDQMKMVEALRSLELLVHTDIQMTPTAQLADYVIAAKLPYEISSSSILGDAHAMFANGFGYQKSYASYAPAVVEPPEGSDVLAGWQVLYGLARRLGVGLMIAPGLGELVSGGENVPLDMEREPTEEELLDIVNGGGRIPFDVVKSVEGGRLYPDTEVFVKEKADGWEGRLNVGAPEMMADLAANLTAVCAIGSDYPDPYPYRLLSRRVMHVVNTPSFVIPSGRKPYNPASMNPADLEDLGLESGDLAILESPRSSIVAVVEADASLRRGMISMSHAFGGLPGLDDENVREHGSNPGRLIADDKDFDRYTGQPRMSDIPVRVVRMIPLEPAADGLASS
ncbi:molybdopterin-dependent oxidoreductase [Gordonia sp. NPDC058843]|uniref:molybdopterin-containing oxidoreductase family protein n=1 Tax=Gordonia sp. NPDC058843 TaxID=3346648 RepID=UPI00369EE6FC